MSRVCAKLSNYSVMDKCSEDYLQLRKKKVNFNLCLKDVC